MKKFYFIMILIFIYISFLNSTIINIPADQPTIQAGINVAVDSDTVLVQPDTYYENINYIGKNITIASLFLITQDTIYITETIIDGNYNGSVVTFESGEDSTAVLTGFTITTGSAEYGGGIFCRYYSSPSLQNVMITGNSADDGGGGIFCRYYSSPSLDNVTITGNSAGYGGGIYCRYSSPCLDNVTITGNSADDNGGGIYCWDNSNPSLVNVTITGNSASKGGGIYCINNCDPNFENVTISGNSASQHGGGIYSSNSSCPNLVNCILWNNSLQEVYFSVYGGPNTITISYSDIQDGETGIVTNNNGTVNWLEGNIDADPLFVGTGEFPYALLEDSPCIDAGNPDPIYYDPEDPNNPGYALYPAMGTIINDMGAYGGPNAIGWSAVDIEEPIIPNSSSLITHLSNYPNPFNPSTTISFSLNTEDTELVIYNIKGQKIKQYSILNIQSSIVWDGTDENGKNVSSGIYFYKLKVDDKTIATKKCLLLK